MLNDNEIAPTAYPLTLEVLKAKGFSKNNYMYIEIENTLYNAEQADQHMIAVGWPDNTYCFFSSSEAITFNDLFATELRSAYYKSFCYQQRQNNLW